MMEGEVYPVAGVGAAHELGWARECAHEVAGVLMAHEVAGVMAGKMKNEGLDHNSAGFARDSCYECLAATSQLSLW